MLNPPTLDFSGYCTNVTNCTASGQVVRTPPTLTTDTLCAGVQSFDSILSKSITASIAGGALAVVLLLGLLASVYIRKESAKHSQAMQRAQSESTSLNERMERLLGAWEIVWEHIELGTRLAEGSYVVCPRCLRTAWQLGFSQHALSLCDRVDCHCPG
jgi:hypothetical protein